MINKVFFPSTFITQAAAGAINRRIGRFAIYQPIMGQTPAVLQSLGETDAVDVRHPVIGNEAYLVELCRAYNNLGSVYQKDAFRLSQLAGDGFYNQDFAAEIRTEILKGRDGVAPEAPQTPDPLINARMFLQLSQEFDHRESEIRRDLEKAESASRHLFEALRGENIETGAFSGNTGGGGDAGAVMTEARLSAWALLSKNDTAAPHIFVTDSRAVMAVVLERFPSAVNLVKTTAASDPETARRELDMRFSPIAGDLWPGAEAAAAAFSFIDDPCDDGFILDIYAIPEFSSEKVLESFVDIPLSDGRTEIGSRHAFFCLISAVAA